MKLFTPFAIAAYNRRPFTGLARYFVILREFYQYRRLSNGDRQALTLRNFWPWLIDRDREAGKVDEYFYQDLWCIEHVTRVRPQSHVDVGSALFSMAALSKVVPVTYVDLRPVQVNLSGFSFLQGTLAHLPFPDNSVESISSLSVVEHIGLGRYGDPLDPQGTDKACAELGRVLKPGGYLYAAVPTEKHYSIHFNAHRIFSPDGFISKFDGLILTDEQYATCNGLVSRETYNQMDLPYAYGCFRFTKRA
jgi:SAM-dependent methyltransferase